MMKILRVKAEYDTAGQIRPVSLIWDDLTYNTDKIIAIKPSGAGKNQIQATEYVCIIGGHRLTLFFDVERRIWWIITDQSSD